MTIALNANILLRFIDSTAAQHPTVVSAIDSFRMQGRTLRIFPQAIYEFRAVATRPIPNNSLGLSPVECGQTISGLLAAFPLLDDKQGLFHVWRNLVSSHACQGKVAYDARYVAAMQTHTIKDILTFNTGDFTRYPNLTILDPAAIAGLPPSNRP